MSGSVKDEMEARESEGGAAPVPLALRAISLAGTPNQVERAERIRRQVKGEFDRVHQFRAIADRQNDDQRANTEAIIASRLSVGEIARRLAVSKMTVCEMLEKGILPGIRLGRRWIITRHKSEGARLWSDPRTTPQPHPHGYAAIFTVASGMSVAVSLAKTGG
jgi:excisionase family DNA binding protein